MRKSLGIFRFGMAAGIIAGFFISTACAADSFGSGPVLVFRIVNSAQVPDEVLAVAQKHVESIYRKSGVRTEWLTGPDLPDLNSKKRLVLTILLVADDVARSARRPDRETGFAISHNGRGARRAYVFVGRAGHQSEMVARLESMAQEKADGLVLGCAIAHEAGHLMLPPDSHTFTGIMRPRMDMESVGLAIQGRLVFHPGHSKLIQAALMAQSE